MSKRREGLRRRQFLGQLGVAAAAGAAPLVLPARLLGASAPSNRLRIGQIGCGRIAQVHDMPSVMRAGGADIVAVCDLDGKRTADAVGWVQRLQRETKVKAAPAVGVYRNYQNLLDDADVDAVVISTPDHWHAQLAYAAVRAGKHVYLQKPFTMTHAEGVLVRDAVEKQGCIMQIGSQQRSMPQFRQAAEFVRSGRIGAVQRVEIGLPIDPTQPDPPSQKIPPHLDFDMWLGPTKEVPYTETGVHPQHDYSRPGWLRNEAYCLGMITGWGSHHFDSLHWALDCEHSGPLHIEGRGTFPQRRVWNVHGEYDIELSYPGGVKVSVSNRHDNGLKFFGDDGWIWVTREGQTTASDPGSKGKPLPPLDASNKKLLDPNGLSVQLPRSASHHENWLQAVRSGSQPLAPAAVAHRSGTACILSWIAMKLGTRLTWNARWEHFEGNAQANAMLSRPERAPYGALRMSQSRGRPT